MRQRQKIEKVSDLKHDPDMRIVFQKEYHAPFVSLLAIGEKFSINPTTLSRHVLLNWERKFTGATEEEKQKMILSVVQSMHGVNQIDLFIKPPEPLQAVKKKAVKKKAVKKKAVKK